MKKKHLDHFWMGMTEIMAEANDLETIVITDVLARCPKYLGVSEVLGEFPPSSENENPPEENANDDLG